MSSGTGNGTGLGKEKENECETVIWTTRIMNERRTGGAGRIGSIISVNASESAKVGMAGHRLIMSTVSAITALMIANIAGMMSATATVLGVIGIGTERGIVRGIESRDDISHVQRSTGARAAMRMLTGGAGNGIETSWTSILMREGEGGILGTACPVQQAAMKELRPVLGEGDTRLPKARIVY